ncbi:MAG: A/G-specific adenine glycosylase [Curvibacter sp. RIFCSPHIGHO2_12_FULL_63_18]|nr:MAG: A/G-specific adenine glycosylase [Curvibacter sp. GWA2_63_95]OGP04728.1 MAG: A/G-specific adenine glycosylase [Curvibacter sp. RIFCSPHIGHO2_12_FULL_63_18]HCX81804.1 A/G-specific adenine glycosylase [Rhodoferax sp.]
MSVTASNFATQVVAWQRQHGRNTLPWQNTQDPYRVWLSEIMLQQTQVVTVIGYFAKFLARCPTVADLAAASSDEVMGLWSGLGYYSRARNLHRCAQLVVELHGGKFPRDAATLTTLPGIGRSTAAAIASLCFGERVAILDANVKRVVTRVLGFDADLASSANEKKLWDAATGLLPAVKNAATDMPRYTQGMMDLGATVCSPKKPSCLLCPVHSHCAAAKAGDAERYPVRTRKLKRSSQSLWLLWVQRADGAVWLAKRPTPGVWAGLQCFPLFDSEDALRAALPAQAAQRLAMLPVFTHVLTHKDLFMRAARMDVAQEAIDLGVGGWFLPAEWAAAGLPAPVRKLLEA